MRAALSTTFYGPRTARWTAGLATRPTMLLSSTREYAHEYASYLVSPCDANHGEAPYPGAATVVTRIESCPVPGCDGHGVIRFQLRSGRWGERECPCHVAQVDTVE